MAYLYDHKAVGYERCPLAYKGVRYSVHMKHAFTSKLIDSFDCHDYALAGLVEERASGAVLFSKPRLKVVLEGTLLDEDNRNYSMARYCRGNTNAVAQVTIVAPRCYSCHGRLIPSDSPPYWNALCECDIDVPYILRDYGYRSVRNWASLYRVVMREEEP